jgi:uncharacterized protein YhaN
MSLQIESLRMRNFGPFGDTTLDLGSGGGALHVICGPNEAGKTTTQRAIGDFIFGIPARTPDGHEFGFAEMRLEATVIDGDGVRRRLIRRKGNTNTLLDGDGNPVDEGLLSEMLGGLTREAFTSMLSITHQSLVDGGEALLAADGNLGESLFSASLGAAGLHALRGALRDEADKLFRPKATSTRIAHVRSDLQAAEVRLGAATLRATPYLRLAKDLETAKAERGSFAEDLEVRRGEQLRRDRLRVVLPKVVDRAEAIEELAGIDEAPQLAASSEERRLRIEQDLINHRRRSADAEARVERLSAEAAALRPDEELLRREQAIVALAGRLPNVAEAKVDLERQSTKVEVSRAAADRVLGDLRAGDEPGDPGRLRVGDAGRARVSTALQVHSGISGRLEESVAEEKEAIASREDLERRLGALDEPEDIVELRAAAEQARPHSALEGEIANAKTRLGDAEEELQLALADLHPAVAIEVLLDLDWPDNAELETFISRLDEVDTRERDLFRAKEENAREASDLDAARRSASSETLPDEKDLTEIRASRDSLWATARARLEGRSAADVDPEDFEGRVQAADRMADRLREEADQVAARAQREERRAANQAALADLEEKDAALVEDRNAFAAQWEQLWRPYGIRPRSPREMEAWLGRRSLAVERSRVARQVERGLEADESLLARHLESLRAALRGLSGNSDLSPDATLDRLLAVTDHRIATALEATSRRDRLGHDLDSSRAEVAKHHRRAGERRTELESWQTGWKDVTSNLGWPSEIGPREAGEQLERVVVLSNHLNDAEEGERRCRGIENRIAQFEADAAGLLDEIEGTELPPAGPADAVADLARRLDRAKELRQRREDAEERLTTAREDLAEAISVFGEAEADLSNLMEQAGVTEPGDLAAVERRSERVRLLRERVPRLEEEIVVAGMEPLDDLLAACEGLDIDQLEARSKGAGEEIARIEKTLGELDVSIGTLDAERRQMESAPAASVVLQEVENLRAELGALTEDYLRTYVASWALGRAIDDYRQTHKAPLLARAEALFPRLTNGRFKGLEVGFDTTDQPVLVGIKADGKRLSVKAMSEGPREQLYLSLRQASIERHIELHGAVPVVLDDVVLHSDPNRKKAILRSLAELAERTQVITFSHDPQVVALAQASVHPDLLKVHEFGDGEITGELQSVISKAQVHPIGLDRAA